MNMPVAAIIRNPDLCQQTRGKASEEPLEPVLHRDIVSVMAIVVPFVCLHPNGATKLQCNKATVFELNRILNGYHYCSNLCAFQGCFVTAWDFDNYYH